MKYKKIYIIGISGSGKTYLANKLSKKLKIDHLDLDDIFWISKYDKKRTDVECEKILKKYINKDSWIVDGVYSAWTDVAAKSCDVIVWLHYPIYKAMWGAIRRHFKDEKKWKSINELFSLLNYIMSYRKIRAGNIHSTFEKLEGVISGYEDKTIIVKDKKDFKKVCRKLTKI